MTRSGTHHGAGPPNSRTSANVARNGTSPVAHTAAEGDAADEQAGCGERDGRQPLAGPRGDEVVARAADHRGDGEGEAERVDPAARAGAAPIHGPDDEQEPRDRDDRTDEHHRFRHPPGPHPDDHDQQQRRHVFEQDGRAHRDALDRREVDQLRSRHPDQRHPEHPPPAPPERRPPAAQREHRDGREDDAAHQRAHGDGGGGTPSRFEQRLDEGAREPERRRRDDRDEESERGRGALHGRSRHTC